AASGAASGDFGASEGEAPIGTSAFGAAGWSFWHARPTIAASDRTWVMRCMAAECHDRGRRQARWQLPGAGAHARWPASGPRAYRLAAGTGSADGVAGAAAHAVTLEAAVLDQLADVKAELAAAHAGVRLEVVHGRLLQALHQRDQQ